METIMENKDINLRLETEKWADKWMHKKLTGRAYKELRDIEKEFIRLLKDEIEKPTEPYADIFQLIDKLAGDKLIK